MTHYRMLVQTFWCDAPECRESHEEHGARLAEAWAEARSVGWRRAGRKHLCPVHASAGSGTGGDS